MPSTASATAKLAPTRRAMLQRFLVALDAFHAAEQSIDAGVDPSTGGELAEVSRGHALSAAAARLTEAFHVAIDTAWKAAADEATTCGDGTTMPLAYNPAARLVRARTLRRRETALADSFGPRLYATI